MLSTARKRPLFFLSTLVLKPLFKPLFCLCAVGLIGAVAAVAKPETAFAQAAAGRPDPTLAPTPSKTQPPTATSAPSGAPPLNSAAAPLGPSAKPKSTPKGATGVTTAPGSNPTPQKQQGLPHTLAAPEPSKKFPKIVTKLIVDDLQKGRGRAAKAGSRLRVHYSAWLYDPTQPLGRGPQFETTQGKEPYAFTLQSRENPHIRGWEEGLVDFKVGGRRRLIVPADLAYGTNGAGQVIPPNATLMFEIELLDAE